MKHRRFDSYLTHHSLSNRLKDSNKASFIGSDFRVSEKELYMRHYSNWHRGHSQKVYFLGSNPRWRTIYAGVLELAFKVRLNRTA